MFDVTMQEWEGSVFYSAGKVGENLVKLQLTSFQSSQLFHGTVGTVIKMTSCL